MDISYLGQGSVKLSGRQINVVCDPTEGRKASADAVLITDPDLKAAAEMVIDGPGEYEIKGSLVQGVATRRHIDAEGQKGTAYMVEIDDVRVAFLGNIAPGLSNEQLEDLGSADVLVVPVGGHGLTLDATAAAEMVSRIEPKYVIPTHYDDGTSKYAMPQDKVDKFLGEMGAKVEPQPKLKLSGKDEAPLETTVVVLEAQK